MAQRTPSEEEVMTALSKVEDPELHRDIVSLGMVKDLKVEGGDISLRVVLTTPACPLKDVIKQAVERAVLALPGVQSVSVQMDADVQAHRAAKGPRPVEGVRHLIAIASNKGGVGKTTVAINMAVALGKRGARVGLLDGDITGPNIPTMVGLEAGFMREKYGGLTTVDRFGVRVCSLGFLMAGGTPMIWRGPMVGKAVGQLLHELTWGELDYLIVDLPPGTSDASLSLAQEAPLSGVVIVTTPQDVSLEDARKAVSMFDRLNVPVFGVIENMSYFVCPHCGERTEVFGHGGARAAAEELGLEFLGEIPLDARTREAGDAGVPIVEAEPESPQAGVFVSVAENVAARCSVLEFASTEVEVE
jgi:ATP-binding protein involved in chromosome partitioning